jgi:uncharacterized protein YdeI (YjbR/CyaY-like superfamily)
MKEGAQYLTFTDRQAWRAWLEAHHDRVPEAWLIHYKKGAGKQGVSYDEAVEEALCFGWIDGLMHGIDGEKYALRYSPRKPRSVWAESNKRRVEKLIQDGRMTPAGLALVALAKESGAWDAATAREDTSQLPGDLVQALESAGLLSAFEAWPPSRKKQQLFWLNSAKRDETRQKRVQAIVAQARGRDAA